MIALYSDGSMVEVATPKAALALVTRTRKLDGLYDDGDTIPVPMSLVVRLDREAKTSTTHTDRDATTADVLRHVPGRRAKRSAR